MGERMMDMNDMEVAGVIAVQQRLIKVAGMMGKKGQKFPAGVPDDVTKALKLVRQVWHRITKFKQKAWTPSEVSAMQDAASWLIRKDAELRGIPIPKTQWTPEGTNISI